MSFEHDSDITFQWNDLDGRAYVNCSFRYVSITQNYDAIRVIVTASLRRRMNSITFNAASDHLLGHLVSNMKKLHAKLLLGLDKS